MQALTAIAVVRVEKRFDTLPSLVVCPASLTLHWEQEISKFFPPALLSPMRVVAQSGKGSAKTVLAAEAHHVVIASYDSLRTSPARFQREWQYAVLDEAHLVRNPRTAAAQAVFALRARSRVALSGTPVQNQVDELWSLMHFLLPDYLGESSLPAGGSSS